MNFKDSFNTAIDKVFEKLQTWLEQAITMFPNIIIAILVTIAFIFLARGARKLFKKIFKKYVDKNANLINLSGNLVYIIVLSLGLIIALSILNLEKTITSLLAGAGVVGLAIGFAFRDTASNFISGFFISFRKPFLVGDLVESNSFMGIVRETNLRSTVIESLQGIEVIVPNQVVFQNPIINYTSNNRRRLDLSLGVSYSDDLKKVEKLAKEAVKDIETIKKGNEKSIDFIYTEFGDSSINFTLRMWLTDASQSTYLHTRSEAIKRIKTVFDDNDINIPFPIRTLDFGMNQLSFEQNDTAEPSSDNKSDD